MEKPCGKYIPKANPGPSLLLVNNPKQPLHERNYFTNRMF